MKLGVIFFIGPPGAGKTTQAQFLADELGFEHIEVSVLGKAELEKEGAENIPELKKIKELFNSGQLYPSEWINKIVEEKVKEIHAQGRGIVFGSYPRNLIEVEKGTPLVEALYGKDGIKFLHVDIPEDESVKRNSHRRVCRDFGHPILPRHSHDKCPKDGSDIIARKIDNPEIIRTRFKVYEEETKPILDYLKENGYDLISIDGKPSFEDVHKEIMEKL